jgi:hypothetical protein
MSDVAERIVKRIVRDLSDRQGLKHEWRQISPEIQREIRAAWREIVEQEIART